MITGASLTKAHFPNLEMRNFENLGMLGLNMFERMMADSQLEAFRKPQVVCSEELSLFSCLLEVPRNGGTPSYHPF